MKIKDIAGLIHESQLVSIVEIQSYCRFQGKDFCKKKECYQCDSYDCGGCENENPCPNCTDQCITDRQVSSYEGVTKDIPLRLGQKDIQGLKIGFWVQPVGKKKQIERNRLTIRI